MAGRAGSTRSILCGSSCPRCTALSEYRMVYIPNNPSVRRFKRYLSVCNRKKSEGVPKTLSPSWEWYYDLLLSVSRERLLPNFANGRAQPTSAVDKRIKVNRRLPHHFVIALLKQQDLGANSPCTSDIAPSIPHSTTARPLLHSPLLAGSHCRFQ